ncbi:hypothetical protein DFQ04_1323 [Algoriphagus boseongensis]|uniref:DUF3278 domain-containing protein n=1 Tax=Algoriphagus boseongensis TaxID=1442587 RepID=A0A4R6T9Q0_9BACT|nr:hypothetical protein [Algoriphagus boseongensis]TDQ19501.1 hypothetical protein DFQ04_1323 [Algoriphagus boseongensis]
MELEDMKSLWAEHSQQIDKQEKIKKELLMKMTKKKYLNKLGGIYLPEILGAVICLAYAGFFIFQIGKLELPWNQVLSIFNTTLLIVLPILSLYSLFKLGRIDISEGSSAEILERFTKNRIFFWKVQRFAMVISGLFAISILPPLAELVGKIDLLSSRQFWMVYVPIGVILVYIFTKVTMKKYQKALSNSEQVLKELEV